MSKMGLVAVHCNMVNVRLGNGEKIGKYWYDYKGVDDIDLFGVDLSDTDLFDDSPASIIVHSDSVMGGIKYSIEPLWTAKYVGGPELSSQLLQEIFTESAFQPHGDEYRSESRDGYNQGYIVTLFDTNSDGTMLSITGPHGSTLYMVK